MLVLVKSHVDFADYLSLMVFYNLVRFKEITKALFTSRGRHTFPIGFGSRAADTNLIVFKLDTIQKTVVSIHTSG